MKIIRLQLTTPKENTKDSEKVEEVEKKQLN